MPKSEDEYPLFVDYATAAEILGYESKDTIRRMVIAGKLKKSGGKWGRKIVTSSIFAFARAEAIEPAQTTKRDNAFEGPEFLTQPNLPRRPRNADSEYPKVAYTAKKRKPTSSTDWDFISAQRRRAASGRGMDDDDDPVPEPRKKKPAPKPRKPQPKKPRRKKEP